MPGSSATSYGSGASPSPVRTRPPGGGATPPGPRRGAFAWASSITAAMVLITFASAYVVYRHFNGNLHQVDISRDIGSPPADFHPQAENILVLGSDTRRGVGRGYGSSQVFSTERSDTLLIVHLAADRKWADVMSIPRDSWVNIPSCRMGNGQLSSPVTFKINEAFMIGNLDGNRTPLGIACTVKTVEQDTGIHIDHFVAVNFAGFRDMVKAVGGVPECNIRPIDDPQSGLRLTAGHHLLTGRQALAYVRARYTLGDGSDLGRISRQQAFMSALVERARAELYNPVAIYHFLDAATRSVTVDQNLGGVTGLYQLASSVRGLPPGKVTFFTVPTYARSLVDPADTANVMWTQPADSLIFQAFRDDVPVTQSLLQPPGSQAAGGKAPVVVLNGTPRPGLQETVAGQLAQDGFLLQHTGTAASEQINQTVISYHAGEQGAAQQLSSKVRGAALREVPGRGPALTLLLGSNYGHTATVGNAVLPQPAPSLSPRTATQNICT